MYVGISTVALGFNAHNSPALALNVRLVGAAVAMDENSPENARLATMSSGRPFNCDVHQNFIQCFDASYWMMSI